MDNTMPSTHYLIKSQPESALLVSTNNTVQNEVGICYFDPIDETLKEITLLENHVLTSQPFKKTIKKYYLIVNPTSDLITSVEIQPIFGDLPDGLVIDPTDFYNVKLVISNTEPTLSNFDDLDNMNSFTISNPAPGSITSIWVLVESKIPLNAILDISFDVNYE